MTDSGRKKTKTGKTVLYSRREDDSHHDGAAIIMKKGSEKYLRWLKTIFSTFQDVDFDRS